MSDKLEAKIWRVENIVYFQLLNVPQDIIEGKMFGKIYSNDKPYNNGGKNYKEFHFETNLGSNTLTLDYKTNLIYIENEPSIKLYLKGIDLFFSLKNIEEKSYLNKIATLECPDINRAICTLNHLVYLIHSYNSAKEAIESYKTVENECTTMYIVN